MAATGSRRSRIAYPTSSLPRAPPPPARSTGSQTSGTPGRDCMISSTVSTICTEPSMPSLTAATGRSAITALAWASTQSRSRTRKSETLTVSCTVRAVTAGAAWQPWAIRASISAWRPAPPLGSWPERQRTTGRELVVFMVGELTIKHFTGPHRRRIASETPGLASLDGLQGPG
ncbi:hypothetical protein D9M71_477220 [compost metagenome]